MTRAIDRHLNAFETGSLDADICGEPVPRPVIRLQRLVQRRDNLARALNSAPGKSSQKAVDWLRSALIEANVMEIHFEEVS